MRVLEELANLVGRISLGLIGDRLEAGRIDFGFTILWLEARDIVAVDAILGDDWSSRVGIPGGICRTRNRRG